MMGTRLAENGEGHNRPLAESSTAWGEAVNSNTIPTYTAKKAKAMREAGDRA